MNNLNAFLDAHGLLSIYQSGFHKQHSTITAAVNVVVCPGRQVFFLFSPCPKGCATRFHIRAYVVHNLCNLCDNLSYAVSHLYADDTVIYCSSSSALKSLELLQSAFDTVQFRLPQLKLVLNADESDTMLFSNGKQLPSHLPRLSTVHGVEIEMVTSYK